MGECVCVSVCLSVSASSYTKCGTHVDLRLLIGLATWRQRLRSAKPMCGVCVCVCEIIGARAWIGRANQHTLECACARCSWDLAKLFNKMEWLLLPCVGWNKCTELSSACETTKPFTKSESWMQWWWWQINCRKRRQRDARQVYWSIIYFS